MDTGQNWQDGRESGFQPRTQPGFQPEVWSGERRGRYAMIGLDSWLEPYEGDINARMDQYMRKRAALTFDGSVTLSEFANGHMYFGFQKDAGSGEWVYREWAPEADAIFLIGDFNDWNKCSDPLSAISPGVWEIRLQGEKAQRLCHMSLVKARVISHGTVRERIPLFIKKVTMDENTKNFSGQIWDPPIPYEWGDGEWLAKSEARARTGGYTPLIYESHVGMAQNKDGIGTYLEFAQNVLPRIKDTGYNTVQLMAIAEHPYYASFGYQVSNFYAPSQWFGTPDELKQLVDTAHSMGIAVLLDIVHSHAVMNINEGINEFDGTSYQFFHAGAKGTHSAWGTKLFNYGKNEVLHYLLSNIKYWMNEFHFDGFRFDGVTSMIYLDHGLGSAFDRYEKYFSMNTDFEALVYLQLANELIHAERSDAVSIAEDMSGMPGMCLPIQDGGMGFDYRLSMGVPDFWIRMLKTKSDEQLSMQELWYELTTRRPGEKNIGYAESHDQALVGDKTLIFWLADKEMYYSMAVGQENYQVDRAMALHKMIRFVTMMLGGEGYLNFMGNEFGHPEWIDFPREGNGWSFKYAKRRWDLADDPSLRYRALLNFDRMMLEFAKERDVQHATDLANLWIEEGDKLLAYRKANLIFLFNFNPGYSAEGYELPLPQGTPVGSKYRVIFNTDRREFDGQGRISEDTVYEAHELKYKPGNVGVTIYSPARTALVLAGC